MTQGGTAVERGPGIGPDLDRVRAALGPLPRDAPPSDGAGAAVLAVLREGRSEIEALLLERAVRADDPASGQVSLPGGRRDAADSSLLATALREFEEEVGLARGDLEDAPRYLGSFPARAFDLRVAAFAAVLGGGRAPSPRSLTEVADVFWLPLSAVSRPIRARRATREGLQDVDATMHEGHVVWGFTHRVLRVLWELVRAPSARGADPGGVRPASDPGSQSTDSGTLIKGV
jgi:8-oxo-dGTP pyrophosphatase MutT (NUDIX family)